MKHVFSVNVTSKQTQCVSCNVKTALQNKKCLHNSAKFSEDSSYYVLNCAGPGVPEIAFYSSRDRKLVARWENNGKIVEFVKNKALPKIIRFNVTVDGGYKAQVSLRLPPNMDESVKYPMIVNV